MDSMKNVYFYYLQGLPGGEKIPRILEIDIEYEEHNDRVNLSLVSIVNINKCGLSPERIKEGLETTKMNEWVSFINFGMFSEKRIPVKEYVSQIEEYWQKHFKREYFSPEEKEHIKMCHPHFLI